MNAKQMAEKPKKKKDWLSLVLKIVQLGCLLGRYTNLEIMRFRRSRGRGKRRFGSRKRFGSKKKSRLFKLRRGGIRM